MKFFSLIVLCFIALFVNGQNILSDPFKNPVILNHYTTKELQHLQQTDSVKFKKICYYYSQSFIFEEVPCEHCEPVTLTTFDVAQYEYLRQKSKRYTRSFG